MAQITVLSAFADPANAPFLARLASGTLALDGLSFPSASRLEGTVDVAGRTFTYVFEAAPDDLYAGDGTQGYQGSIAAMRVYAGEPGTGSLLYRVDDFRLALDAFLRPDPGDPSPDQQIFGAAESNSLLVQGVSDGETRILSEFLGDFGAGTNVVLGSAGTDVLELRGDSLDDYQVSGSADSFQISGGPEALSATTVTGVEQVRLSDGSVVSTADFVSPSPEPPQPPQAVADSAATEADTAVAIDVLANDSDPDGDSLSIASVGAAANGTVTQTGAGTLTYTPDEGFSGEDSFTYTVTDPGGATDGAEVEVSVAPPEPGLSLADASIAEGDEGSRTLTFTVSLDAPAPDTVTFTARTVAGTAEAGSDFIALDGVAGSIAAGDSATQVAVDILGDRLIEPDESFTLSLSDVTGAEVVDGTAQGTIENDDQQPGLSIGDAEISEGDSGSAAVAFQVTLDQPAPEAVTLTVSTADGTAEAGTDYVAATDQPVTIEAGQSSAIVQIDILGDTALEPDETFTLQAADVQGAAVVDGEALGTIRDNETVATFSTAELSVPNPEAIAVDPDSPDRIFLLQSGSGEEGSTAPLAEVTQAGDLVSSGDIAVPNASADGLDVRANGNLLVSNSLAQVSGGGLYEAARDGTLQGNGPLLSVDPPSTDPDAVAVDPESGNFLVVDDNAATLYEFAPDGSLVGQIDLAGLSPPIAEPQGVAIDPATGNLFVADDDLGTGQVFEITREGSVVRTIDLAQELGLSDPDPEGLDYRDGLLYVADDANQLVAILNLDVI